MKNLRYIDQIKGIGIIAVVMLHSGLLDQSMTACISAFIMPLFFMASGMLLNHTQVIRKPRREFYYKRAKAVFIPYVIFGMLYLVMGAVRGYTTPELFGVFFENVTLFGNSVLWFLPCLFMAQVIVYEVYRRMDVKKGLLLSVVISAIGYCLVKQLVVSFPKDTLFWQSFYYLFFSIGRALFAVGFVGVGYWMLHWLEQIDDMLRNRFKNWGIVSSGIVLVVLWIVLARKNGATDFKVMAFGNIGYYILAALAATSGMVMLCKWIEKDKFLAFCGKHSLIIMLTHLDLQYLNISIKCGEVLQKYTGSLGTVLYWIGMIGSMIFMEVITIYICNRYLGFLFGKINLCKSKK